MNTPSHETHASETPIYHPSDEPGYVEAHLEPEHAELLLRAAISEQSETMDTPLSQFGIGQVVAKEVSGRAKVILTISQEGPSALPVEDYISRFGQKLISESMRGEDDVVLDALEFNVDPADLQGTGLAALDFADRMRRDRARLNDSMSNALLEGSIGEDGLPKAA